MTVSTSVFDAKKPGKDESTKCFLSFLLLWGGGVGGNTLVIATDNSLNTGVSEIQEFAAGSLTV